MFAPGLYRAKAVEYGELAKTVNSPEDTREFQRRERSFVVLADNEQWLADHQDQTVRATDTAKADEPLPNLIGDATSAVNQ
jgi:hypothetical protein